MALYLLHERAISVWGVEDTPPEILQLIGESLTPDVVWLAFVPASLDGRYISFLQSASFSSDGGPEKFTTQHGSVYVGRNPL